MANNRGARGFTAAGKNGRSKHCSPLPAARSWRMPESYRPRQRCRGWRLLPNLPAARRAGRLRGVRPGIPRAHRPCQGLLLLLLLLLLLRRLSSFAGACRAAGHPFRAGGDADAADLYVRRAKALRTAHLEHSRQVGVIQAGCRLSLVFSCQAGRTKRHFRRAVGRRG